MSIFYFHPQNSIAKDLAEINEARYIVYNNRAHLEFCLQNLMSKAGYDIWSTWHTVMGGLGRSIEEFVELNPDNEIDARTLKMVAQKTPWSWVKIMNGNTRGIVGYCSQLMGNPYAMSNTQMAQTGIIGASFVPSAR